MVWLFIVLILPCIFALIGKYNYAKISFWIFLIVLISIFVHHVTDAINIQL